MNDASDSEDFLSLSEETIAALQEYYSSRNEQLSRQYCGDADAIKGNDLEEDWQLSQFWYDDCTAEKLVEEALDQIQNQGRVALIGCPSLYYFFRKKSLEKVVVKLFDIDRRFEIYEENFVRYDYNHPLPPHIPSEWSNTFDIVIMDPPFLSEECLLKCASTAKFLSKNKVIVCTGIIMESLINKILGARRTIFVPTHKHNLKNEFACFINYCSEKFVLLN